MKVLVTGGAGFIGSHIVDQCIEQGHHVVVVDNFSTGNRENLNEAVTCYQMDLTSPQLEQVLMNERPKVVFHQAAQTRVPVSIEQPIADAQTNIMGTIHLLEAARRSGVEKTIFASTAAVYGNPVYLPIDEKHPIQPLSGYGAGKHTAEHYLHIYKELYGIEYTILRYANVYGIRQNPHGEGGVVSIFIDRLLREESLTIYGDGTQTRDYINVQDVARANLAAIDRGHGEILNIGTGEDVSLNQLIQLFEEVQEHPVTKKYASERTGDIKHSYFDPTLANQTLNWKAEIRLKDGLRSTFTHYQTEYAVMHVGPKV
ncbi:UDP-glucose 4-epimerase [Seinonella peptonophila]|uniref:UDP-glucose 4-epimerase n=1 Tax=Seinonella peptonophila TaxID=112248 RepID=A0A1M4XS90_9BACL|nr:NAD-dependent epimerase/dehydratase family protein [Seinonella peptonophila]SHE96226.1 UDP-glucose 4-epimerase [Seinonella peptonophila]